MNRVVLEAKNYKDSPMKVSIYTPTKNRKESLAKAIDSVLNQTYKNIEIIVVSDGSTDDTPAYLEEKSKLDRRVRFFHYEESRGAPVARNIAIRAADGDFITGLDDDDEFLPNRVEMFVEYWQLLKKYGVNPSCIYSQDIITRHGSEVARTQKKGLIKPQDLFEFNFIGNQVFAPKSHYHDAGLFDEAMPAWQDMEFFMRILKKFGTAHLLDCATQYVDDTPKQDRISIKAEGRVRDAYAKFIAKHPGESNRDAQKLFFQIFSRFYGVRPGLSDWVYFLKLGFWPKGMVEFATRTLRY